jgi:hypothetical protein
MAISPGNMKLGSIPNISLPPITTCRKNAPCARDCYALKSHRLYQGTQKSWQDNFDFYIADSSGYFHNVTLFVYDNLCDFFRWHVGGDIPDANYLNGMVRVAKECQGTKFLCFTKQYEIVNGFNDEIPKNLSIIFSGWPGLEMDNRKGFPIAWMQDGNENRCYDKPAIECPGLCQHCFSCWYLTEINYNVVFKKH